MITITNSHKRGFWRGGHYHPKGDKDWPIETFTQKQLALIEADQRLTTDEEDGDAGRAVKIFVAIQQLDPENKDHFTGKGAPQTAALMELSGFTDITAKERDELWAEYQQIQAEGNQ